MALDDVADAFVAGNVVVVASNWVSSGREVNIL
jgi:hypothetical protein